MNNRLTDSSLLVLFHSKTLFKRDNNNKRWYEGNCRQLFSLPATQVSALILFHYFSRKRRIERIVASVIVALTLSTQLTQLCCVIFNLSSDCECFTRQARLALGSKMQTNSRSRSLSSNNNWSLWIEKKRTNDREQKTATSFFIFNWEIKKTLECSRSLNFLVVWSPNCGFKI